MGRLIRSGACLLVIAGMLGGSGCRGVLWPDVARAFPTLQKDKASAHVANAPGDVPAAQEESTKEHQGFFTKILPASWMVEEEADRRDPAESKAHLQYAMGIALEKKGEYVAAEEALEGALRIKPDYVPALIALARVYQRTGRPDVALQLYDRLIELSPDNPTVWNDRGMCYRELGDLVQAESCLRRAVELDPMRALYRNNLGMVLAHLGYEDQAWEEFRLAVGPALAHYNLAVIAWEKGDLAQARRRLEQALALDPQLDRARSLLQAVREGKLPEPKFQKTLELQSLQPATDVSGRPQVRILGLRPDF